MATPFCYSVSTPPGAVHGKLAYPQEGQDFLQPTCGRIGLLIGSLSLGDHTVKQRLLRSRLATLLVVDSRNPYWWPLPCGAAPQWMDGYNIATVGLSYCDAIRLVEAADIRPLDVEVALSARTFPAESQNVIGEVVGTHRPDQVIVVSAHYDNVPGNVGANDDASGTVLVLELARLCAQHRPRRTVRFIAYRIRGEPESRGVPVHAFTDAASYLGAATSCESACGSTIARTIRSRMSALMWYTARSKAPPTLCAVSATRQSCSTCLASKVKPVRRVGRPLYRHPWSVDQFRYTKTDSG